MTHFPSTAQSRFGYSDGMYANNVAASYLSVGSVPVGSLMQQAHQLTSSTLPTGAGLGNLVHNSTLLETALAEEQRKNQLLTSQLALLNQVTRPHHTALQSNRADLLASAAGLNMSAAAKQFALNAYLLNRASSAQQLQKLHASLNMSNMGGMRDTLLPSLLKSVPSMPATQGGGHDQSAHSYRDASLIPDPINSHVNSSSGEKPGRRGGAAEPFPQKLHRMLEDLESQDGGTDVASFLPHGRAFGIHNPKKFVSEIMPKYFRMSRFSSFQRQLNLYDFKRITEGRDKGAYYHELFLHGRPALCTQMKRTKIKGNTSWLGQGGYREEINFYNMPPVQAPPIRNDRIL